MTEAPTLDERYICAMKSSHLEVVPHKRGDVDFVMAAGAARRRVSDRRGDDVAGQLVRLQQEFDQARSEVHLVERNHQRTQEQAKVVAKRGGKATAAQMRDGAYRDALMARAHILLKLPSRAATKEAFGRWAREQALKVNFMAPGPVPIERAPLKVWAEKVRRREEIIRAIAGRVRDGQGFEAVAGEELEQFALRSLAAPEALGSGRGILVGIVRRNRRLGGRVGERLANLAEPGVGPFRGVGGHVIPRTGEGSRRRHRIAAVEGASARGRPSRGRSAGSASPRRGTRGR